MKLISVCVLLCGLHLFALDDTLGKGRIQFRIWAEVLSAEDYFDQNGEEIPAGFNGVDGDYDESRGYLEFAYGWDRQITIIARADYVQRELDLNDGFLIDNDGFTGTYLAVRQRLSPLNSSSRLMAETGVWVPTDADENEALPIEADSITWTVLASYNQDFFPTLGGFELDLGYHFRNGRPDDEVFVKAALRFGLFRRARLRLFYDVVESQEDLKIFYSPVEFAEQRGHQILGAEILSDLSPQLTISAGYKDMLEGRNVHKTSGFRLGLIWRR